MTYHTGTINIPVRDDLVIPDIDYSCRVSVDRNGDVVVEDAEVSLWSTRLNCFDSVEPTEQMAALIDADVTKDFAAGRIDIEGFEPRPTDHSDRHSLMLIASPHFLGGAA